MNKYYFFAYLAVGLNAAAQLTLKKGADVGRHRKRWTAAFTNSFSLLAYTMFLVATLSNLYALAKVRLVEMVYITSLNYILVIVFSVLLFKEKVGRNQLAGMALILLGVTVFNMG